MPICEERLTRIRERTEAILLVDLCTIYAPPGRDATQRGNAPVGTYPTSWTVFASAVPCRVTESRQSGSENAQASQVKTQKTYDVLVPATTPRPLPSYRIRVTSQGNRDLEITHPVKTSEMSVMKIESKELNL
jgi:hypothetical protein